MKNDDIDMFKLFVDKISSIVLDSITNEEVMEMVNNEVFWGGEVSFHHCFSYEEEQEEIYKEFLKSVDQSYFEELAEIEELKRELSMVV